MQSQAIFNHEDGDTGIVLLEIVGHIPGAFWLSISYHMGSADSSGSAALAFCMTVLRSVNNHTYTYVQNCSHPNATASSSQCLDICTLAVDALLA